MNYADIEKTLQSDIDSEEEFEDYEISDDNLGEDIIITFGPIYRVTDKNLIFVEGTYCVPDSENPDTIMPDWSLTLIYENVPDNEFDIERYLYFEQDGPEVTIHNFRMMIQ